MELSCAAWDAGRRGEAMEHAIKFCAGRASARIPITSRLHGILSPTFGDARHSQSCVAAGSLLSLVNRRAPQSTTGERGTSGTDVTDYVRNLQDYSGAGTSLARQLQGKAERCQLYGRVSDGHKGIARRQLQAGCNCQL